MREVVDTRHDPIAAKNDPSRKKRTVHQVQFLPLFAAMQLQRSEKSGWPFRGTLEVIHGQPFHD
jgi:hypothetical protein